MGMGHRRHPASRRHADGGPLFHCWLRRAAAIGLWLPPSAL